MSIISIIRGSYIHILLDHSYLPSRGRKEEYAMVVGDLISFVTGILSFVNTSLYSWDSYYGMTLDLFKMTWHAYIDTLKPLRALSLFSASITLGLFGKIIFFDECGLLHKLLEEDKKVEYGDTSANESSNEKCKKHQ
eukprot:491637_1